ncbi:hypothetical protein ACWT_4937 [Actinoplanes sp. SE50]|uniref:tetratricopeptide repeat protein n=1 Tax=unclassified Actinoplanes TaxID=2626549 RepID=UPI00023EC9C3|nr:MULTISPECIES: tetratricopeptide repeat protein [unclassified Actinoplanes]AEV85954.1 TPR repeat-containing protein [Actinoplanes sp. SE50/110]ATO84352.1 hypothetical protein ACWT_4937 [Actinoplanes sp. SE50]SLM01762.1 uncharacterized protein ACSP50_5000 [Actinoplanes sp. SE50/110]
MEIDLSEAQAPVRPRFPAALLRPEAEVVAFRGRHRLLDELGAWCSGAGFAALLLHGPAGQGKTRVAGRLAARLAAVGWGVHRLSDGDRPVPDGTVPTLIVADRAETRPEQIAGLLTACAAHDGDRPLRLLLLARSDGPWWQRLRTDPLLAGATTAELAELDDDPAGRREAYAEAVRDLGAALPRVPGQGGHLWSAIAARLAATPRDAGGHALTVQMEALADLLDAAQFGPAPTGRSAADRLLVHESRVWSFTAAWHGLAVDERILHDVLAAAMLTEPTDRLLDRLAGEHRDAVGAWLADLDTAGHPLAERFCALRLAARPALAEILVEDAPERVLSVLAAARHPGLTELCVRHADRLTPAVLTVAAAADEPEPLLAALVRISADPDTPVDRLTRIAEGLPRLSPLAAEVAQSIAERHRRAGDEAGLALALSNLSIRLGDLGRDGPALAAIEEAAVIHRRLAGQQPELYEADLARSLTSLSVRLGAVGQPEPALSAIAEATELYQRLTDREPESYRADLARSARNLALAFGGLEMFAQALTAIQESVAGYRVLAVEQPGVFLPELAAALSILAINLGSLDEDEASRAAAADAVTIRRHLADRRPDAFRPSLAAALTDLAVRHIVLGEAEPALAAIEEALTIRQETGGEDLDWSLHVKSVILGNVENR